MFNHQQNHGAGMSHQQMMMQRLMASRQRSSGFMPTDMQMSTPAELHDRRFPPQMGWAPPHQQRTFGFPPQQNLLGFPNRSAELNNFGMVAPTNNPIPPPASIPTAATNSSSGGGGGGGFIGNSGMRMPLFKCPECNIVKNSSEDLEIHLKTEHLNWLPFVCPHCNASRASDIQMREHMHSFHKKNENKYIYLDNPQAKKLLQEIMDKALFGASAQFQQQQISRRNAVQTNGGAAHQQSADFELPAKRSRLEDGRGEKTTSTFKKIGEGSQQKQGMTTNSAVDQQNGEMEKQPVGEQSELFGVKSEFDMSALDGDSPSPHQSMLLPNEDDDLPDDNSHQQMDVLQKVTAMLSASSGGSGSDRFAGQGSRGGSLGKRMSGGFHKRIVRNRPGPMTSKKRVLGECQRCHKPITAGARQMHMFFHLGKDMQTYRFRCRHVGCDVEHYRKDQMENHQSKAHGRVDLEMMEDRTQELYNLVQKMSMELLGTAGNTPGPTAAKAQQLYDQQMRELQTQFGTRKRRLASPTPNSAAAASSSNFAHRSNGPGGQMVDSANRKLEDLECRLCHKNIMSRIRGFHILWHLNNDLGIVRYGCKYCNFKHDRPQSVVAHGARDHGDDDACEDLLYNFESELKSMSKACFGVERLFEKEIRRRNKLERDANRLVAGADDPLMVVGDEDEDSQASDQLQQKTPAQRRTTAAIASLKVPLKVDERSWAASSSAPPKETVKKRRSLRRFGTRRTKSRKQKEEMIKLREVSMRLGGAQYFKKKTNEAVPCEKCGKMVSNRLSDHAYSHLEGCDLFRCQECNLGHFSRETIVRHLRDFHNSSDEPPLDNRLRFAQEIKDAIRECYPRLFVDAPIPTKEDIEKMKASLKSNMDMVLVSDKDGSEEDEDDEGDDEKEEEEDDGEEEAKEEEEEHHVDELAEQTVDYEADGSGTNEEEAEADQQDGGDDEEVILDDDEEEEGEEGEEEGDDHDYEDELEEEEEMEEEFEEGDEAKEVEEDDEGEEGEDEEEKFVIEGGGNSAAGQPKAGTIVGEGSAEKKNKKDTDIAAAADNVTAVAGAKTIAAAE